MLRPRTLLRFLIPILALIATLPANAQDKGSITGRVMDKKTGHAIPFANVTVVGAQRGALTDAEGSFVLSGLVAGTYEVKVQFLGYTPDSRPGIVVTGGKTTVANFQLQDVIVRQEKVVEVTAERRLVEVKQGATIRSVNASEIRNLPVQTIGEVLQQQAGINTENDQIHVRGGRADETVFVVNGVANRDLVTGQSTAGQLNARSVAEINVATGAYDVRYGNALSGVVEIKLKEGGEKLGGGLTVTSGSYGARSFQALIGGPDPALGRLLRWMGVKGTFSSIVDLSGNLYETRYLDDGAGFGGIFGSNSRDRDRLRTSYVDSFFGHEFRYRDRLFPAAENRWGLRYGLAWKPNDRDKISLNASKRIELDQGFSRSILSSNGDLLDPVYPWIWDHRIDFSGTVFDDNIQTSLEWRRSLSATGFTTFQVSRYFTARREDVRGKHWSEYEQPDDRTAYPDSSDVRRDDYFFDSGDDSRWQDRRTETYGLQWSMTQRVKRHELEVGFEHESQSVQYLAIEEPWIFDKDGLGRSHDLWEVHPWIGNVYFRDRLEYEGFTANIGLRADYWFLGREAEEALADTSNDNVSAAGRDQFYDETHALFGRRFKYHLSPRVIVAHPITENSSFFFNYGEFTQIPSYLFVYRKLTSISSESYPRLGNLNLNPQVSVNYEVGAKHQFLPTAAVNATFFVKDVYDYPVSTRFDVAEGTTGEPVPIFVFLNGHFARSRGFEVEIEKRRSNRWAGKLAYTFQQTKGKSSDPNDQTQVQIEGGSAEEARLAETFVRWNRPHKVTASFDLRFDSDESIPWALRQLGLNVFFQGQSGRPYTPANAAGDAIGAENSRNAPFQTTTDLRINRWIKVGSRRLDLSLAGQNIFDSRLISRVDPQTGEGREWGVGTYDYRNPIAPFYDEDLPNGNPEVYLRDILDPSNYGTGAQWRLSLDYDF